MIHSIALCEQREEKILKTQNMFVPIQLQPGVSAHVTPSSGRVTLYKEKTFSYTCNTVNN